MTEAKEGALLWEPAEELKENSNIAQYMKWLEERKDFSFEDYHDLWEWSVAELEEFWVSIWEYFNVQASKPYSEVLGPREMPGAEWFPGAELNYAEHVFHNANARPNEPAIMHQSEVRDLGAVTWQELYDRVSALAAGLKSFGVERGDRVVAYVPNTPEALVAFLATASLGATWSSCSPDFGAESVVDRFAQIEPKVLIAVDGLPLRRQRLRPDRDRIAPPERDTKPSENGAVPVPEREAGHRWARRHSSLGQTALRE